MQQLPKKRRWNTMPEENSNENTVQPQDIMLSKQQAKDVSDMMKGRAALRILMDLPISAIKKLLEHTKSANQIANFIIESKTKATKAEKIEAINSSSDKDSPDLNSKNPKTGIGSEFQYSEVRTQPPANTGAAVKEVSRPPILVHSNPMNNRDKMFLHASAGGAKSTSSSLKR